MNSSRRQLVLALDTDFNLDVETPILRAAAVELRRVPADDLTTLSEQTLERTVGLFVQWSAVTETIMDLFPNLRAIGRVGVGVDLIDLGAATRRGVWVVTAGDYATEEVSAHALMLMLATLRRLPTFMEVVAQGAWPTNDLLSGIPRLSGLAVGVVGAGRIGRRFGALCTALGMRVVVYDPYTATDLPSVDSLEALLQTADVVSLHVPLTDDTVHMIGAAEFALMKPGAVLVNVSRGGLIDEQALVLALERGRLGGAALDVFAEEPLPLDHPLMRSERVIATPHVAYASKDTLLEVRSRPVRDIVAVLRGAPPQNPANHPVTSSQRSTASPEPGGEPPR